MSVHSYTLHPAEPHELPAIEAMQQRSLREIGGRHYSHGEIDALLTHLGTLDAALVDEGHFFVAVDHDGEVAGCGGWSRQKPHYAAAMAAAAAPLAHEATVRSVYVDPGHARRGVATALMQRIEADAATDGIGSLSLASTLSGVRFYAARGYRVGGAADLRFGGVVFPCVAMGKSLAEAARREALAA